MYHTVCLMIVSRFTRWDSTMDPWTVEWRRSSVRERAGSSRDKKRRCAGRRASRCPGTPAYGRNRMRNRRGVPMRTSALRRCAPAFPPIRRPGNGFEDRPPGRRCRTSRSGSGRSDPAVRGPATGSGRGWLAHPRALPFGSLRSISPCRKAPTRAFRRCSFSREGIGFAAKSGRTRFYLTGMAGDITRLGWDDADTTVQVV